VRTTVNIDDELLARARQLAVRSRRPLGDVVDDALRLLLSRAGAGDTSRSPVVLPRYGGSGLRPGVDLDDKDGLATLLDEPDEQRAVG
jgi:Bacterial antitoxin of type II TA system, VapB